MSDIICISPIDGNELVRRPAATAEEIDGAIATARAAQREWRRLSIGERSAYVLRFLDAMLASNQEVVPELAQQMGRPCATAASSGASRNASAIWCASPRPASRRPFPTTTGPASGA